MTEPIAYATTRYRCPHCRKSWGHRANAVKHEARCFMSPAVRSCKTCRWFEYYPPEPEVGIMAPGYQCHADEREDSTEAVDLHCDRCSTCGGRLAYDECSCDPLGPIAKPVFGLRVLCPKWEAKK